METIVSSGKKITFEVHGEKGDWLMMVNGLMMTDKSWLPLLPTLKENYRVICANLHDMGSSEMMTEPYTNELQADAVKSIIDHLGIEKINLCGTSYGGTVSLLFALKYPDRVKKMMLFNTLPYADAYLTEVGRLWQKGALTFDVDDYYDNFAPFVYAPWYFEKHYDNIYKRKDMLRGVIGEEYYKSIVRLSKSVEGYDVRDRLKDITAKVLIVGCEEDYLTPMRQQRVLAEGIPGAQFVVIPNGGHGVVYENSEMIVALAIGWFRDIDVIAVF